MRFKAKDERVKNDRAMITRVVERIVVESSTAATLERPDLARAEHTTRIKNMVQVFSKAVNACVLAQIKENKRFWTYLQHLEAQKHRFPMYMKNKDVDFPDLLLQ